MSRPNTTRQMAARQVPTQRRGSVWCYWGGGVSWGAERSARCFWNQSDWSADYRRSGEEGASVEIATSAIPKFLASWGHDPLARLNQPMPPSLVITFDSTFATLLSLFASEQSQMITGKSIINFRTGLRSISSPYSSLPSSSPQFMFSLRLPLDFRELNSGFSATLIPVE